jgi:hypothetical protein
MKKGLLLLVVAAALAFSGCSLFYGKDGTTTLTVQTGDSTYDTVYAVADSSLNWGSWSMDTANSVASSGTYTFRYNTTRFQKIYGYYFYYVNAYSTEYSMYWPLSNYYPYTVGQAAYNKGYYYKTSVALEINKGSLFQDGADHNYVLTLYWNTNPTISGNSVALESETLLDTPEKTVKVFTSARDKITLTTTREKSADMLGGDEVKVNGAEAIPSL